MFFSPSTGGFYNYAIHGYDIPHDAIEISPEEHARLLAGQSAGQRLVVGADGSPALEDPAQDLEAVKDSALTRIVEYASAKRTQIAGTSDSLEIVGWSTKARLAQAVLAGLASADEIAILESEISARSIPGETLNSFVQKVAQKSSRLSRGFALVDGLMRQAQTRVTEAATGTEVADVLAHMRSVAESAYTDLQ